MDNVATLKGHPMAMDVRLEVPSGAFVVAGRIPKFQTGPPPVLTWGTRTFQLYGGEKYGDSHVQVYRECFAVALVDVD